MPFFLYDIKTLSVKSAAFGQLVPVAGEAVAEFSGLIPQDALLKRVNCHPNPKTLVDNSEAGARLVLQHDARDTDADGIPDVPCANGVVRFTVQMKRRDDSDVIRAGVRINLKTSCGRLSALSIVTDAKGRAAFSLQACQDTITMDVTAVAFGYDQAVAHIQCRP